MKKQVIIAIAVLLALAIIIGAIFLGRSIMGAGVQAYQLLESCIGQESLSMELIVNARLADSHVNFSALVERSRLGDHAITTVTRNGQTLCYTQGVVLTETGMAYRLTDRYPDQSQLLEQALELYRLVDVKASKGVYTIIAGNTSSEEILQLLLPGIEADADELSVELVTERRQLKQLRFRGDMTHNGKPCEISATVNILGSQISTAIPDAVQQAIRAGKLDAAQDLTEDLLRLAAAWSHLQSDEAMGATLTLSADCSLLKLQSSLTLYRKGAISAIEKYGLLLYFTDRAICDQHGNSISASDSSAVEAGRLLDLAWQLCMEGQLLVSSNADTHTYTLALDRAGMIAVAQAISPDTDPSDITFQSGSVTLILRDDRLQRIGLRVSGDLQVLMLHAPMTLNAEFSMLEDVRFQIPPAVQSALG